MNETAPVQKQDVDRLARLLELILQELKAIRAANQGADRT